MVNDTLDVRDGDEVTRLCRIAATLADVHPRVHGYVPEAYRVPNQNLAKPA
jgi:hypothetical protein